MNKPKKTKFPMFHFYKMTYIFADFDARRKPLDSSPFILPQLEKSGDQLLVRTKVPKANI